MAAWNVRRTSGTVGLLLAAAFAACGGRDRSPADEGRPDPLTGIWDAELVVTRPLLGRADSAEVGTAGGRIALLRQDRHSGARGLTGVPTHVGIHTLALHRFGFEPQRRSEVPGVVARWIRPDSVELAFESPNPDESFTIHGRVAGDSIVGSWHYGTRVTGAAGRLRMQRSP